MRLRDRQLLSAEGGSTIIEFAMSLVVLLTFMFGIFDCSLLLYANHYVTNAARDAARYAMVRGSTWGVACATPASFSCTATGPNVTSYVQSSISPMIDASQLTVTTDWLPTTPAGGACNNVSGNNSPTCTVRVKVNYTFHFLLPFLPADALTLSSTSVTAILQ